VSSRLLTAHVHGSMAVVMLRWCVTSCATSFLPGGVVPGVSRHAFKTPFSEGVQSFPVWRPWLDAADAKNILFARCCTSSEAALMF
jgi:hypothetical protein